MRLSWLVALSVSALASSACLVSGPATPRQLAIADTANYTKCSDVQVDCVDDGCTNMQGGSWTAFACGQRYRCTRAGDNVGCVPLGDQQLP